MIGDIRHETTYFFDGFLLVVAWAWAVHDDLDTSFTLVRGPPRGNGWWLAFNSLHSAYSPWRQLLLLRPWSLFPWQCKCNRHANDFFVSSMAIDNSHPPIRTSAIKFTFCTTFWKQPKSKYDWRKKVTPYITEGFYYHFPVLRKSHLCLMPCFLFFFFLYKKPSFFVYFWLSFFLLCSSIAIPLGGKNYIIFTKAQCFCG